ncbi:MAG: amino acid adenylation domain-containing protein [Planctomycetes bacterium]|nr:amino acid adenylation domain-containing protein [Planctomycetota bacterium]
MLLHDLFRASVARHPDGLAVDVPPGAGRDERRGVTYRELAAMADRVAAALAGAVTAEARVVVLLPRSDPWLFAAQLGVLQAGAAHVCLDPAFPDDYVAQVIADAGAAAIVTDASGQARCAGAAAVPLIVPSAGAAAVAPATPVTPLPDSLAYVIYTSGTTGRPKGVLLEHRGAVNLIREGVRRFGLGPGDRIAQGSSAAYDSSIEETWLALASGATVVVLDDETVRLGPDLAPWLRRERVTVLCPPPTLLRAMDLRAPAVALPALRLCYVGGEPLSEDLAATWGGALWLENGYGPTECTVTVVRGRVRPGEPVTIGEPVPPHRALLLDERLQPVADGEAGELCIAGPGLARGYLGHDELTRERFPTLPEVGRVYRTGDLVVRDPDGRLRCLGRIDAQVKVRGHRIELESVEAQLAAGEGVREVVCAVQGEEPDRELVAFVVPRDPASPPDFAALARVVAERSPGYAVPTRFALLAHVPRTVGGKVDRRSLPQLVTPRRRDQSAREAVALDERVRTAMAGVLGRDAQQLAPDDDFFAVGGNSLRAALLVSELRRWPDLASVAVRDVYATPSAAGLAATLAARAPIAAAEATAAALVPAARVIAFTSAQLLVLAAMLVVVAAVACALTFGVLPSLLAAWSLPTVLLLGPWLLSAVRAVLGLGAWWLLVAAKELLIGSYRPTSVSAWSGLRLRHWIVGNLARAVPWALVEGTELHAVLLRGLGARVGRRVHLHRGVDLTGGGWDLLEIGDDATLGREVDLGLCELHDGRLVIGAVRIGEGAVLEARSGTAGDVVVGDGAVLGPLAFAAAGARLGDGELWCGVPAARVGAAPPLESSREGSSWRCSLAVLASRLLLAPLAQLPLALLIVWWLGASDADGELRRWLAGEAVLPVRWWSAAIALPVLWLPLSLLGAALWLRLSPAVAAGELPRWSMRWHWLESRTALLERAGLWLSGTLFWPWWLRLAGMRVGRDVEVSTILDVLPERTAIGAGSFLADGVYLGVPRIRAGHVTVADTSLGERTFVGNHVVVPGGERLPDDLLLGVCTVGDAATMRAGTAWFGQPALQLPQREVIEVDRRLTHEPGPLRYANRLFWESLRLSLPALPTALALWWCEVTATGGFVTGCVASFVVAAVLTFVVLATKWLLLGRVRPGQHGLWSCWASRWDFHYVLWQRYGRALLMPLEGTLLIGWFLRAIGVRLGRRCVLGRGFAQVVDPDMLTIGDGATVHALFQAHSFEDRVLKIAPVRLGAACTVGRAAVVLYGADIGEGARVTPHSVVMKHELLLPGRDYAGAPSVEIARAAPPEPAASDDAAPAGERLFALDAAPAGERLFALDAARGVAVLGMVWLHFVPEPADAGASFGAAAVDVSLHLLEGVPAALFMLLAGASWALSGRRDVGYVARRALTLAAIGVPFWCFVWPYDVLTPMAIMLPMVVALLLRGRGALIAGVAAMLLAAPLVVHFGGDVIAADQLDDGTHRAHGGLSWATLRYFTIDGAYPLLPWLLLPLLGALLADVVRDARRLARWCCLALPLPAVAWWCDAVAEHAGEGLSAQLAVTWQPTSLPFLLRCGGAAVAVAAGFGWWAATRALPRWVSPIAAVGRASLTHYLLHIAGVYASLRLWWPDEDWPLAVGIAVAVGYVVFALVASRLWFRSFRRGPLEALLRLASRGVG